MAWVIESHPAPIVPESLQLPYVLVPPHKGTTLNVLTLPPDNLWQGDLPPASRTNIMFVKSVTMENDGHEEEQI